MTHSRIRRTGLTALSSALFAVTVAVAPVSAQNNSRANEVKAAPVQKAPAAKKPAPPKKAAPPVKMPSNVVARVNGQDITGTQVLNLLNMFGGQPLVQQMVQTAVVEQEAKKLGVSVTQAELNQEVQQTKDRIVQQQMMTGQPMTFEEIALRDGITEALLRWSLRRNLLTRKAFAKSVEKNVPTLNDRIKVAHILVSTMDEPPQPGQEPKPLTEDEKKAKDEAARKKVEGLLADIKAGKISFEEAAKQHSDDKMSGAQGGVMDYYPKGTLVPEFEQAAWDLKDTTTIAGPVKTQFGYHLIRLISMGKDAPAADKAKFREAQLQQQMNNPQAVQAWLGNLLRGAKITMNPNAKISGGAAKATAAR